VLQNKTAAVNGTPVSYWENAADEYTQTVVFFSPGALPGDHFEAFADFFPKNIRVISPDFPGIGKTPPIHHGSIADAGQLMHAFISHLELEEATLVGISYGGFILDKVLGIGRYKKAILIATGEFYSPAFTLLINILSLPPRFSATARKIYKHLYTTHFSFATRFLPEFDITENTDLDDLLWLLLSGVNNRVDTRQRIETETSLVFLKDDKFIGKQSVGKLQSRYVNSKIYFLDIRHTFPLNEAEGEELKAFLNKTLRKEVEE